MPFDSITTYALIKELTDKLVGNKINKIYMPTKYEVVLHTFGNDKNMLLINAGSSTPRVHFIESYNASMNEPFGFCMLLRKYLTGAIITGVEGYEFDRIIQIHFESINLLGEYQNLTLIAEVMGRNSNLILVDDESGKIIDSIKHIRPDNPLMREVVPKIDYEYPTKDRLNPLDFNEFLAVDNILRHKEKTLKSALMSTFNGISPIIYSEIIDKSNLDYNIGIESLEKKEIEYIVNKVKEYFKNIDSKLNYIIYKKDGKNEDYVCTEIESYNKLDKESFSSPSLMIDEYYRETDRLNRLKVVYKDVYNIINRSLAREEHKLELRRKDLSKAQGSEKFNIKGQLLLSNLHLIKKGDKNITVLNFFKEPYEDITISLNPALSPSENANKYFKKYTKLENSKKYLEKLIKEGEENVYFLESQSLYLERAKTYPEVEEIKQVLENLGYIRKKKKKHNLKQVKKLVFKSSDGYEIYVGRNSMDNDYLTRKFALKTDLWIHTKDIPSSHVIIRTNNGVYSKEALELGCKLCVYYSKAKNSSNVAVDYTYIKYVKKPSGMKDGKVIYTDNETVQVTLSEEDIKMIDKLSN
ncbi:NFACT RNA binding domain-containing protein [Anaerofustis sp.]|uniref:Rqc2 family fibronectin-binding protein n=1 Tax=Anaerofustis sp. TaxID=1872517 RepID=UPI0025BF628E|nr:NFACT RNA binding domain-containing protein [Anaerofustis sp.]